MYSLCISIFKLFVLKFLLVEMFNHGIVRDFLWPKGYNKEKRKDWTQTLQAQTLCCYVHHTYNNSIKR